jgi:hypothetical protein
VCMPRFEIESIAASSKMYTPVGIQILGVRKDFK